MTDRDDRLQMQVFIEWFLPNMVSYHTPKVYRSPFGCCICGAKSSSSRFTDSSRYESEFYACFKLQEQRYGEICNACVLLIKRWKKLPPGTKRNWNHVVDARARPRGRSTGKSESGNNSLDLNSEKSPFQKLKKHKYIRKSYREGSPYESEELDLLSETSANSMPSSRVPSPSSSPSPFSEHDAKFGSSKRKQRRPTRRHFQDYAEFIDHDYWTKEKVCCGFVFKGTEGELLINPEFFKPCCSAIIETDESSTPNGSEAAGSSLTPMSDVGSMCGDDLESLDEECSSGESYYRPSSSVAPLDAALLTEFASALIT